MFCQSNKKVTKTNGLGREREREEKQLNSLDSKAGQNQDSTLVLKLQK